MAINPLLVDEGLTPPENSLLLDEFRGMTAEEIYPCLDESHNDGTLDQHVYDVDEESREDTEQTRFPPPAGGHEVEDDNESALGQSGQSDQAEGQTPPPPLNKEERETLKVQWQQRLAGAAQQALQAGKLGGELARMLDHLLQPQLPWRMLLARYMTAIARDDYSYLRASRREGDFILPRLQSGQIELVVAVDVSGSIKDREMMAFLSEIDAIKGQTRAHVILLPCDAEVVEGAPWIFEPWENVKMPISFTGGGGTDFRPVFDWVARQGKQPELLVYFTDAEGFFPEREPQYPVIWLVKGRKKTPWGQRIQLN